MTGKEIIEICKKHKSCDNCELDHVPKTCGEVMRDMQEGAPDVIYEILEKEYGGDS